MITFESIKWKNFLSTGDQWTEIQLNESALYGIGGKGQSSNQVKTDTFRLYYSSETWSAIPGAGDDLETARRDGASMATSTHGYLMMIFQKDKIIRAGLLILQHH